MSKITNPVLLALIKKEKKNRKKYKDVFEEIDRMQELELPSEDEKQGFSKALILMRNYLINK